MTTPPSSRRAGSKAFEQITLAPDTPIFYVQRDCDGGQESQTAAQELPGLVRPGRSFPCMPPCSALYRIPEGKERRAK